ncbi:ABC transporter transmembrane domain-containing protein [Aurantimonas sp. 22II-16-19i]|uniref:ABC transporter transmembrane domain-containing protein n=1 Tax=Aurantimonas sp. 22II-16-19i TaxID=1317114 RepID=UPI0009F7B2AF|nr:ABC transporter transmembrane domain-containing protein [Aurantimonas sp. 22II-16-19i]ORE89838.1 multidrug ABC transporter ATP-binding and permease [Aurantimonas sp. 22II-16-19i]
MTSSDELDESVFRYVWRYTRSQQLWLFAVLAMSLPLYYLTLDLPKRIVNGPISGDWQPGQTQTLFGFSLPVPEFLGGGELRISDGVDLDRFGVLIALSLTFLFFVIVNGLFKFYLSTYKGKLGERLLRRLRFQLVDRVLRFPSGRFKQVRGSEIASMIKDETEPVGGFGGSAFADPALLLSQALTALFFIVLQNFWLGLVAGGIVLFQIILIPRMRRRLVVLARSRQLTARLLSGRIGEVVEAIPSIRTNDTSNWERAELGDRLGKILKIRYDFYQWKFFVNFLNNLIAQMTPFIFYLGGGYLVITGRLDIGQLVAVIAAYKDLPAPLKELIAWDQNRVDVQSKYLQIREQFVMPDLVPADLQRVSFDAAPKLDGEVAVSGLKVSDDSGNELLYPTTLRLAPGETVAVVGPPGGGGEYLAEALVRLIQPAGGRIAFAGSALETMPDAIPGRRLGYSASGLYLPQMSVRDVLTYGLKHVPTRHVERTDRAEVMRLEEARLSGNLDLDIRDDWIDYEAAGVEGPQDLAARLAEVLDIVELKSDIARLGLRGKLPERLADGVPDRILDARARFRQLLIEGGDEDYFESFDKSRYSDYATVFENLVFGTADPDAEAEAPMAGRASVQAALRASGLDERLYLMGRQIAETLIEIFGDLAADNPLLDDIDLMSPDDVELYRAALRRTDGDGKRDDKDRQAFQRLAFGYVEPRHRLGLLDETLKSQVVSARDHFADDLGPDLSTSVFRHDAAGINRAASLQDNILFGRIVTRYAEASGRINTVLSETLHATGLFEVVFDLGLGFDIGSGAKRLSSGQQQKLTLGRALVKRPDLLVLNRPLSALDGETQRRIAGAVIEARNTLATPRQTILWVLGIADHADLFDRVVEFREGRMQGGESEASPPQEVM